SLGCTLFHMLAGQAPFPEGGLTERLYKHMSVEPPDVRDLNPSVPGWLAQVVRRMLAKEPADRYQTPKELLKVLVRREPNLPSREEVLQSLAELELAETRKKKSPDTEPPTGPPTAPERRVGPIPRPGPARHEPLAEEVEEPPPRRSKSMLIL